MRPLRYVGLALLLLGCAVPAGADPRWVWNDAQVATGPAMDLDIDVVPGDPATIFLVWAEPLSPIESWVNVSASFDGGCTFCSPFWLFGVASAEDEVALAAAELPNAIISVREMSVAVLHSSSNALTILHATFSFNTTLPHAEKCEALRAARWESGLQVTGITGRPDAAAGTNWAGPSQDTHFHAVWRQEDLGGAFAVFHARDLGGTGSQWEETGRVPDSDPPPLDVADPRVSVDFLSGAGESAVNVAWSDLDHGSILYLRSTDSGSTFSATGEPPDSPPVEVNVPIAGRRAAPLAMDSGGIGAGDPLWHGLAWVQEMELPALLQLDAQHQTAPTTADPAWGVNHMVDGDVFTQLDSLALSVFPGGGAGEPAPVWVFWTGGLMGSMEVKARPGLLEAGAAEPVDLDAFPFPAVRPGDPVLSETVPITACAIDDALGECLSTRTVGSATHAVAQDADNNVFLAWIDDRTGTPSVWFKRTDREIWYPQPQLSTDCSPGTPGTARVTVTFDQLAGCRDTHSWPEKVFRYLVYYGSTSGGPYDNTDLTGTDPGVEDTIVLPDDGGLPEPVTVEIDGLPVASTVYVLVTGEDEARNIYPPDLDPSSSWGATPSNEASILTPPDCSPGRALYRAIAPDGDTTGLFVAPRDPATDVAFAPPNDAAYQPAPFPPGDPDPDPVLEPGGPSLVFYQLEGADVRGMLVTADRDLQSVRIWF